MVLPSKCGVRIIQICVLYSNFYGNKEISYIIKQQSVTWQYLKFCWSHLRLDEHHNQKVQK